jgi:hypothetical protein
MFYVVKGADILFAGFTPDGNSFFEDRYAVDRIEPVTDVSRGGSDDWTKLSVKKQDDYLVKKNDIRLYYLLWFSRAFSFVRLLKRDCFSSICLVGRRIETDTCFGSMGFSNWFRSYNDYLGNGRSLGVCMFVLLVAFAVAKQTDRHSATNKKWLQHNQGNEEAIVEFYARISSPPVCAGQLASNERSYQLKNAAARVTLATFNGNIGVAQSSGDVATIDVVELGGGGAASLQGVQTNVIGSGVTSKRGDAGQSTPSGVDIGTNVWCGFKLFDISIVVVWFGLDWIGFVENSFSRFNDNCQVNGRDNKESFFN